MKPPGWLILFGQSAGLPDLQDVSSSLQLASTAAAADTQDRQAALPYSRHSSLSGPKATPEASLYEPGFRVAMADPNSCSEAGNNASVASCGHRTRAAARYSPASSEGSGGYDSSSEGATAGSCRLGLRELRDVCLHDMEG